MYWANSFSYEKGICQFIRRTRFNWVDSRFKHKSYAFGRQCEIPLLENRSYLGLKHYSADTGYCLGECVIFISVILYTWKAMINDCGVQKWITMVKTTLSEVSSFFQHFCVVFTCAGKPEKWTIQINIHENCWLNTIK